MTVFRQSTAAYISRYYVNMLQSSSDLLPPKTLNCEIDNNDIKQEKSQTSIDIQTWLELNCEFLKQAAATGYTSLGNGSGFSELNSSDTQERLLNLILEDEAAPHDPIKSTDPEPSHMEIGYGRLGRSSNHSLEDVHCSACVVEFTICNVLTM